MIDVANATPKELRTAYPTVTCPVTDEGCDESWEVCVGCGCSLAEAELLARGHIVGPVLPEPPF